jgi:predicted metal-dependent phosphoesterase TrpH
MVKIDLHVHTEHSPDSFASVKDVITMAKARGLNGIAITDHNSISAIKEAQKIAGKDFLIIPGEEVESKEGHILAIGIIKLIKPKLSAKETIGEIHKQGGIAIAAHPYGFIAHHRSVGNLIKELDFDAVEVFNSLNMFENKKAIRIAEENKLVATVGSDAHQPEDIGNSYIKINCTLEVNTILENIKKGTFIWCGKRTKLLTQIQRLTRVAYNFLTKNKTLDKCQHR